MTTANTLWTDFFRRLYPNQNPVNTATPNLQSPDFQGAASDTRALSTQGKEAQAGTTFQSLMDQINSLQVSKNTPTAVTGGSPLGIRSARTPMQNQGLATGTNRLSRYKKFKNTTLKI